MSGRHGAGVRRGRRPRRIAPWQLHRRGQRPATATLIYHYVAAASTSTTAAASYVTCLDPAAWMCTVVSPSRLAYRTRPPLGCSAPISKRRPATATRRRGMASSPRSGPPPAAPKDGAPDLFSPRFRSAAALAGWDEESLLLAAMVVEDTPVRESRRKRRPSTSTSTASGSAGSSARKRRPRTRRQSPAKIPPVVLALDDADDKTDTAADGKSEVKAATKEASGSGDEPAATTNLPCMDHLREELSCAICLDICFEPSTTPCGHSFCMKCLKHSAAKCGKRCPKCRQLISNSRSCTINTALWNTIQLLFPSEVEARRNSTTSPSPCNVDVNHSPLRANGFSQGGTTGMRTRNSSSSVLTEDRTRNSYRTFIAASGNATTSTNTNANFISTHGSSRSSNSRRGFIPASQLVLTRSGVRSDQSEDAALAYRLQQEEFMNAFEEPEQERQPRNTVSTARENLRAMASRAVRLRARGWPV